MYIISKLWSGLFSSTQIFPTNICFTMQCPSVLSQFQFHFPNQIEMELCYFEKLQLVMRIIFLFRVFPLKRSPFAFMFMCSRFSLGNAADSDRNDYIFLSRPSLEVSSLLSDLTWIASLHSGTQLRSHG